MSFKDDAVLDLRKTSYREHKDHIIKVKDFELLKTAAIYGANASGKSNFISSIAVFRDIVSNQLFLDEAGDDKEMISLFRLKPFLFSEEKNNQIEFEIVFFSNRLFQYGFSIEGKKIKSEWLSIDNKTVFDREDDNLTFGEDYKEILEKYRKMREDRLYIAILDYFAVEDEIKEILSDFKDFIMDKLNIFFEIYFESSIKGLAGGIRLSEKLEKDEKFKNKVAEYLKKIDVGIEDIIIDTETIEVESTEEKKERKIIKTVHGIYDSEGNLKLKKVLDFKQESSGTIRFFSFIQEILSIIEEGGVFIVDELSSRLHPFLTKLIVDIFQLKSNDNYQLVFTTHDTNLMNKEQFRRDEILFIDKDKKGVSNLFALSDLDVRKDASFEKNYFNGKYGAIPIVKAYEIFLEGNKYD